jgi:hypothetical protein
MERRSKDIRNFIISVVVPFLYLTFIIIYSGILKKIFGK